MPNVCPECAGGPLEKLLVLPGGAEELDREVPFSEAVRGVEAVEECRACGARFDPEETTADHGGGEA